MVWNRNGYWMAHAFMGLCPGESDPGNVGGVGGGTGAPAGDGAGGDAAPTGDDQMQSGDAGGADQKSALEAQIEQLKADIAKTKSALDDATREAGKYRKELRAKQTQEEIDAENKKEADERQAKELEELRKKVAKAENTKSVMSKLSVDEDAAGQIAESLIGCENIDNALLLIQKAWTAKEKALRLEYGKIPGPGAGGSSEEDSEEKAAIELAKALGRDKASVNKSVADGLKGYIR